MISSILLAHLLLCMVATNPQLYTIPSTVFAYQMSKNCTWTITACCQQHYFASHHAVILAIYHLTNATLRECTENFTQQKQTPHQRQGSKTCEYYCKGILICQKNVFHEEIYIFVKLTKIHRSMQHKMMKKFKVRSCWESERCYDHWVQYSCICTLKRRVKSNSRVGTIEIGFFDHVQRPICVFFWKVSRSTKKWMLKIK